MLKKCKESFVSLAKTKVIIQTQTETADELGGRSLSWANTYTLFAIVEPLSVYEQVNSKVLQGETGYKVTIRYRSALANTGLTSKYRLQIDSRTFSIIGVKNLDIDMKSYGEFFQELTCRDNGSELV